jgi:hypothetical protein
VSAGRDGDLVGVEALSERSTVVPASIAKPSAGIKLGETDEP